MKYAINKVKIWSTGRENMVAACVTDIQPLSYIKYSYILIRNRQFNFKGGKNDMSK